MLSVADKRNWNFMLYLRYCFLYCQNESILATSGKFIIMIIIDCSWRDWRKTSFFVYHWKPVERVIDSFTGAGQQFSYDMWNYLDIQQYVIREAGTVSGLCTSAYY